MKKVFRPRYSLDKVALAVIPQMICPATMLVTGFSWLMMVTSLVIIVLFSNFILRSSYVISTKNNKKALTLYGGILFTKRLDANKIVRVYPHSGNIFVGNSYAWSSDGIVIEMPRGYKYLITPKEEDEFLELLQKVCPDIIFAECFHHNSETEHLSNKEIA